MSQELLRDHECRIRNLEINEEGIKRDIQNLISKMGALMGWIKALVITFVTLLGSGLLTGIGYVLTKLLN